MTCRAFTLIEMLVATALSAVLIGAVLLVASRLTNDRARLAARATPNLAGMQAFLEWDCRNATHIESAASEQIELTGHNAIDPATLQPTFRMVSVTYQLDSKSHQLLRRQRYLDDPAAVAAWQTVVARQVKKISAAESSGRISFQISTDNGDVEVRWRP